MGRKKINNDPKQMRIGASFKLKPPGNNKLEQNNNAISNVKSFPAEIPIKKRRGRSKLQAKTTKKTKDHNLTNGINGSLNDDVEILSVNNNNNNNDNNNDKNESFNDNNNIYQEIKQSPSAEKNASPLTVSEENGIIVLGVDKSTVKGV